jgi:hypothetical protein
MYDVFYVSKHRITEDDWKKFKNRFPLSQKIEHLESLEDVKKLSFTKFFYVVWNDLTVSDGFVFDYVVPEWDESYIHVFKNGDFFDGICIFSKDHDVSDREFRNRFFVNKKQIDIQASIPRPYDRFDINTYDEYLEAINVSNSDMFWVEWPEVEVIDSQIYNLYFTHHNFYDRNENHVFKNVCDKSESYYNGLVLFSKNKPISKREFDRRYLIDKKEHDHIASISRYNRYKIDNYEQYSNILKNETQPLFWGIWPEVEIIDESIFDLYFDPRDGKYDHDRNENHVFKNVCDKSESYYNGLVLFSKNKPISKREFDRRYLIDKKEHNRVVSRFRYPRYVIESYEKYLDLLEKETQPLFWGIWPEVEIIDESIFDLYFDPRDGKYDHERNENHIFKNLFRNEENYSYGAILFSKNKKIGKKEFDYRYLIEKKEHDRLISKLKPYDIVFISYNEPNADKNFENLKKRFPRAKRVHKVKGIHQAHIEAAKLVDTVMFWVVDGDAEIFEDFHFDHEVGVYERDIVHVWRCQNPVNKLIYGYGGVKLLPTGLTLNMDLSKPDMTTSISNKFKAVKILSNSTTFNTDPFNTWKSAFRECVKLSSKIIDRQKDAETLERLNVWCTVGEDQPFGRYSIEGAIEGKSYGEQNRSNLEEIKKINDFDWLQSRFKGIYG